MKEYVERELAVQQLEIGLAGCESAISDDDDECEEQFKLGSISGRKDDIHSIKSLPTADVEPVRHGKWKVCCEEPSITLTSAGVSKFWFECSLCGRRESQKEPYCHCGAKMDGGNEQ